MDNIFDALKKQISDHQPNYGNGDSVLTLLYEACGENN